MSTRSRVNKPTLDGWTYRLVERPWRTRSGVHVGLEWVRFEAGLPVEAQTASFPLSGAADGDPIAAMKADLRSAANALTGTTVITIAEIEGNAAKLAAIIPNNV